MEKCSKVILGIVYPCLCLIFGLGVFLSFYSDLPSRITVHFDITRVPTTSLPTLFFVILMSTVLVLSVLACSYVASQKKSFDLKKHQKIASYGGFFSAVSASLMLGAAVIHKGLANWQDATGPGWWILLVVIAGFVGAWGAVFLTKKIHKKTENRGQTTFF